MEPLKQILQRNDLFRELSDEELEPIANIAITRTFQEKSMVFMQGDPLTCIYLIVSGTVKIYRADPATGKEQIIAVLQKEELFPHVGFFQRRTYPAHAEVLEHSVLIAIPIAEFEKVLIQNPKITIKLFRVLEERIIDLQNRLEEKVLHDTYEQIVMMLLRLSRTYGIATDTEWTKLNTRFTNRELANMIGITRETINRTFSQLRKKKLLDFDTDGKLVLHVEGLENELFLKNDHA